MASSSSKDIPSEASENQAQTISAAEVQTHIQAGKGDAAQAVPEGKMSKTEVYKVIHHGMSGEKVLGRRFPAMFHVKRDDKGEPVYLEELPGQVLKFVAPARLEHLVSTYSGSFRNPNFDFTPQKNRECVELWAQKNPGLKEEIAPVRELSEPGYTFHRLPFDFAEGPFPLCAEVMERTSNARALMAFIGSLFISNSDSQQYVWWYGEGGDSKGAITRQLARVIGPSSHWEQAPKARDRVSQFWTASFEGKRLILFGDCNEYSFPTSGLFKTLTGGDAIRIEHKGRNAYSSYLTCKFIFLSNNKPSLSSAPADMRRVIYCESKSFDPEMANADYERAIYREMPHFLHECKKAYYELTAKTPSIETDKTALNDLVGANEAAFAWFVETYLDVGEKDPLYFPSYGDMKQCFENSNLKESDIKFLKLYLERVHGILYKNTRLKNLGPGSDGRGVQKWRFTNCRIKEPLPPKVTKFSTYYNE